MAMTIVNQPVLNQEWDFCLSRRKSTKKVPISAVIFFLCVCLQQHRDAHLSRPVSVWNRLSNLRILLAAMVKQDILLYDMTLWISLNRLPLASFPILLGGPQKMMMGFPTARWRNSGIFRATLKTLEWAMTLRLVRFPTSASNPRVGASFMRITHSVWSISAPAPVPRTWLELVTSAQWWQRRDMFLKKNKTKEDQWRLFGVFVLLFMNARSLNVCSTLLPWTGT